MNKIAALSLSLLLSGCIGTLMWGNTGNLDEAYPDIRSVPTRSEATASRCICGGDEKVIRANDLLLLQKDLKCMQERDKMLRDMGETMSVMPLPAAQGEPTSQAKFEDLQQEIDEMKERDRKIREEVFR